MKKILITASLLTCCIILFAQANKLPSFRDFLNKESQFKPYVPRTTVVPEFKTQKWNTDNLQNLAKPGNATPLILPNGNKLSILPQDNMPCVIQDLSQFNMPVAIAPNTLHKQINASKVQ